MAEYVILQQSSTTDLTGGFNNTYTGTGSSSNPTLRYENGLYRWRAAFNNDYNSPGVSSFPKIFIENTKLLQKYRKIRITYKVTQYSPRAYNYQGIEAHFCDSDGKDISTIFYAKYKEAGTTTHSDTVEVEIPKNATRIRFHANANNDDNPSNAISDISEITLVGKRVTAWLGTKEVVEVYLGNKEITGLYKGDKEL